MRLNTILSACILCLFCGCSSSPSYKINTEQTIAYRTVILDKHAKTNKFYTKIQLTPLDSFQPVPINDLANYKSLKKKQSNAEFQQAYDRALAIVTPLAGLPREQQLVGIAQALRVIYEKNIKYSTSIKHYNVPYGYLVAGVASCAGCARTTGLCLNILGIPYEHVNENQWKHQWCRVNINGIYWISDAFGLYVGPEPAPYKHPKFD